eukprot:scaffold1068_cov167-Amphora_coffeaeformis.AAC.7
MICKWNTPEAGLLMKMNLVRISFSTGSQKCPFAAAIPRYYNMLAHSFTLFSTKSHKAHQRLRHPKTGTPKG